MLEQGLANSIPIAIGFLANQFGLGNIGEKIQEIVGGIRELIDRALDWLLDRAVSMGQAVLRMLGAGGEEGEEREGEVESTGDPEHDTAVAEGLAAIASAEEPFLQRGRISREDAEAVARSVRTQHPVFASLSVGDGGDSWDYEWTASPGGDHDTPSQKLETSSSFVGRHVTEPGITEELTAAGYRRPYQQQGRWVIARRDASSGLPRLSVGPDDIITSGPSEDESDRGEIFVELGAILSAIGPHPHLGFFRIDPTAGLLRLGSSLRREALSAYRPRSTSQMRRALLELIGTEETDRVEVPVGGLTELAEVESTGSTPSTNGSGLRSTAMSDSLIAWFVDLLQTGWPSGWEVHHVVPTDWGGSDSISNYAAIPGAMHQEITNWWNQLRNRILRDADAKAAHETGTTTEFREIRLE
jgi:hypothetical protein